MAEIAPFRGILYDPSRVEASKVLAPPYDVIDPAERARLAALDEHNCVRLILPEVEGGGDGDAKYAAARQTLEGWLADGTLKRDDRPAIYRYHQVFSSAELGGRTITRRGFIAAVRLHRFDEKVILPHERTLSGPKVDRLKLKDATRCHLSQIFTLYRDPAGETDRAFAAVEKTAPYLDGTTADGTRHLVWRVADAEIVARVARQLAPAKLYIADGHHRYETMLALRDKLRAESGGELESRSAAEFGTMFLCNMSDSGLVVLPTHRMVRGLAGFSPDELVTRLAAYFEVTTLSGKAGDAAALRSAVVDAGHGMRTVFGLVLPGRPDAYLLTMRSDFHPSKIGVVGPPAVVNLDVSILHGVVFEHLLGIDREAQAAQTNLEYFKDTARALAAIGAGEGQALFLMNATRIEQVKAVADAGEVMPQKSTFFVPKIASGVVLNPIRADEEL
jgi:uncharacterized protein (DUF1015 family)